MELWKYKNDIKKVRIPFGDDMISADDYDTDDLTPDVKAEVQRFYKKNKRWLVMYEYFGDYNVLRKYQFELDLAWHYLKNFHFGTKSVEVKLYYSTVGCNIGIVDQLVLNYKYLCDEECCSKTKYIKCTSSLIYLLIL